MKTDWKFRYELLKTWVSHLHSSARITDNRVSGFVHKSTDKDQVLIWVKNDLTWRQKIMVLAHEYGHIAKYVPGRGLVEKRNGGYSEEEANLTALAICREMGISESAYIHFYLSRVR